MKFLNIKQFTPKELEEKRKEKIMRIVQNKIPEDEWVARAKAVLDTINHDQPESSTLTGYQKTEMFLLYNDRMEPYETGRACPACCLRVYKRLKGFYDGLGR